MQTRARNVCQTTKKCCCPPHFLAVQKLCMGTSRGALPKVGEETEFMNPHTHGQKKGRGRVLNYDRPNKMGGKKSARRYETHTHTKTKPCQHSQTDRAHRPFEFDAHRDASNGFLFCTAQLHAACIIIKMLKSVSEIRSMRLFRPPQQRR